MSQYEVAFAGELMPGFEEVQVKAAMAKLFQADERRIAALFSGRRVVIKTGLDQASAEKYRLTLAKVGAKLEVAPVGGAAAAPAAAPVAASRPAPAPAPAPAPQAARPAREPSNLPQLKVAPRDEYMAAFQGVVAPDFGLAATGEDLQDEYRDDREAKMDLSGMSLAPAGADMNQLKDDRKPVVPDTSGLKMAD